MTKRVRFIHTADIHLGSILHVGRIENKSLADIFNNAVYNCFERLCSVAIDEKVDFIVMSGDIYDRESRSVKANSFFINQCKELEQHNIRVYAIGGNHDPIKENSELFTLPENVHVFSTQNPEVIEHTNNKGEVIARIVGQSYRENWESRKMFKKYAVPKDSTLNIALLHTQLDGSNNYVPCSAEDLKNQENINYWALGHIHKLKIVNREEPAIIFPGIPQGTDFGEEGFGGAVLVEAEDNCIQTIKYIPLSQVVWKKVTVDLDKLEAHEHRNFSDLENILLVKAEEIFNTNEASLQGIQFENCNYEDFFKGYVVRWNIIGRSELYKLINDKDEETSDYLVEALNGRLLNRDRFLFTESVDFNIGRPIEDFEILKAQNTAVKALADFAKEVLEWEDLKQQLVRRLGSLWEVTEDLENINFKKLQLEEEMLASIVRQAEQMIVDSVLQRSEE